MEKINQCPLCDSKKFLKIGSMGKFSQPVHSVLCRHCGLVFEHIRPSQEELAAFYEKKFSKIYRKKEIGNVTENINKANVRANYIESQISLKGKKILEIGSADGSFLKVVQDRGAQAIGIEPEESLAAIGKSKFNVSIYPGTFENFIEKEKPEEIKNAFDVICFFHVLEHVTDPKACLKNAKKLLKSDGLLIIEVPNSVTLHRYVIHKKSNFLRPVHLFNFSWTTISNLLQLTGYKMTSSSKNNKRVILFSAQSRDTTDNKLPKQKENITILALYYLLWTPIYELLRIPRGLFRRIKRLKQLAQTH